ncbi:acyl-CoA-binding domain-containing protein 1-like [Macadamia integrifolia]|uniref:acyl-CoA-binding domain-containing protein 1-like n=1 Tax=Macadamia integrifolia TaxID=60698 RepID=UPI001C52970D|nr:acyl-CoA-binding domain-containing protein 1-like [Macadamia integrifolia]
MHSRSRVSAIQSVFSEFLFTFGFLLSPIIMGMGDWEDLAQSVLLGLIFSFLLAKLISMVISFRGDNLRLAREEHILSISVEAESEAESSFAVKEPGEVSEKSSDPAEERLCGSEGSHDITEEQSDSHSEVEDDDDWEGVETTELDETFSAAAAFVAAAAADRLSQKVSTDVQLQLYGLYKIATEGPCSTPQPSALKISARAKWNAWQKMGALPPEEAMLKYIMIVGELYPSWATGSIVKRKDGGNDAPGSYAKGPMGPVFSSFAYEEESRNELKMESIHASAREGEIDSLLKDIASGVSVNLKDSDGQTPLHWAVDRGHLNIVELLVSRNADVNAKDSEGQTPLHYAAVCDREAIAEYLVKHNAGIDVKDNDGCSPSDLCESNWSWMSCSSSEKPIG